MNESNRNQHRLTNECILKINHIEGRLQKIESNNNVVKTQKAWETSTVRMLSITALSYVVMILTFRMIGIPSPFSSALIPAVGYYLSTILIDVIKGRFIDKLGQQ